MKDTFPTFNIYSVQENTEEIMAHGRVQERAMRMMKGLEHLSSEEGLPDLGPSSLEHKCLMGDPINLYKYLKGSCLADGDRLFSAVLSVKTSTMGPHRNTGGSL